MVQNMTGAMNNRRAGLFVWYTVSHTLRNAGEEEPRRREER
jgi:hypothetical protein